MKIAILGGGVAGLTSAYYLLQSGSHEIVVIEQGKRVGGLASGFKQKNWTWELERTYHHIFSNDAAILELSKEIGFEGFVFSSPTTSSLFGQENNYRIFPVDSPKDFLLLPTLSLLSKFRAGITMVFLKLCPHISYFEHTTSAEFLQKTMGGEVWRVLWERLFRNKYGKYAEKILASFIWARIHKRTKMLGYPSGGFQSFVDRLSNVVAEKGAQVLTSTTIQDVQKNGENYLITANTDRGVQKTIEADLILSTLPYPISLKVMSSVLGEAYTQEQGRRKYLWALNLILKTKKPIVPQAYWVNIGATDVPIMCIVQHTNFVSSSHYGKDELCYVAWYLDEGSELLQKSNDELLAFVLPHLQKIFPQIEEVPEVVGVFKAPFAQPIFDKEFLSISRMFSTPSHNVFIANMDMTFPYDRGTNYAVQLGKDVSTFISNHI